MFNPIIFKLSTEEKEDISFLKNSDITCSKTPNLPLMSLGYHYYMKKTREGLNIIKKIKSEDQFYYVVNPFEIVIANYEESLETLTKKYFNNNIKLSNDFYIVWEMLFAFKLFDNKNNIVLSLTDNNSIIDSYLNIRNKLVENNKDKLYCYGNSKLPKNVTIYKSKNELLKKSHDANLIFAIDVTDNDFSLSEEEYYKNILNYIIEALKNQQNGGTFIFKLFDTFTMVSVKILYILNLMYEEVYMHKPFYSKMSLTEKFIICKKFKSKNKDVLIKSLNELLKKEKDYIYDIYSNLQVSDEFINKIRFSNIKLCNLQQILINKIITYIKENNYFGEKYHTYRDAQIEATKFWTNNFMIPNNNENLDKLYNSIIEKYNIEESQLLNNIDLI